MTTDAMKLNTRTIVVNNQNRWVVTDEEVNGHVVGRHQLICSLRYDGRKQGSMIYAETEEEAKRVAEDRKAKIIRECGAAACDIFPLDAWELRIHAG